MIKPENEFKVGAYDLNPEPNFNFQLNRIILWNGGSLEDIERIASKITDSTSWKRELIALGDRASAEGRSKEAIAYYRMSEFFMFDGDPDKEKYYRLATEMFYEYYREYFDSQTVLRHEVPYEGARLPVLHVRAKGERKNTVLLHGGNDSYFEEFFFPMLYLAENGFDVYLFEGPGQGGVLRVQGKHFTYQWEKPVKAVLDTLKLDDVTIIGASLGGMLAPRAAAFEKRIRGVIAWSVFPSFWDVLYAKYPRKIQKMMVALMDLKAKRLINFIFRRMLEKGDEMLQWGLKHGLYAYEAQSPYDLLQKMRKYQMLDIAPLIEQDMLIIGANKDHFIDYHTVNKEIDALTNVKSLTVRIFTDRENAGGHCNVGNSRLVLDAMMDWIETTKAKK